MESYKKLLINRFWEERRLTHPHLTLCYDLMLELVRGTKMDTEEQTKYQQLIKALEHVKIKDRVYHIDYVDSMYHRNKEEMLDVDLDAEQGGKFQMKDLERAVKAHLRAITTVFSTVAELYYMDVQFKTLNDLREEFNEAKQL